MKTLDFSGILRNLEAIVEKAGKLEEPDERRKILPSPAELEYFKKLAGRVVKLRNKLTTEDGRSWQKVARLERQALRSYYRGLSKIK